MASTALPIELYQDIFKYIGSHRDLLSLLTTTRTCNREAERLLYRQVFLGTAARHRTLLFQLLNSPRQSLLVVNLTVTISSDVDSKSELWTSLAGALKQMNRLKHLEISTRRFSRQLGWIFNGCHFQLETFGCDFYYDKDLVSFFTAQKRMHKLSWFGCIPHDSHLRLPTTALPSLTTLAGNPPNIALVFTPPRQSAITSLWWGVETFGFPFDKVLFPEEEPSTSLLSLVVGPYVDLGVLRYLPTLCPKLLYMQCSYLEVSFRRCS